VTTLKIIYDCAKTLPADSDFDKQYRVHVSRSDGRPIHPQEVHAALRLSLEVTAIQAKETASPRKRALKLVK